MDLLILSAAFFLLTRFLSSPIGPTAQAGSGTIAVQWRIDLRPTIGSDPLGQMLGRKGERQGKPQTSLLFLDDNTIVATFVTREGKPTLSQRDNSDPNQPLRLRAIFLDVDAGKVTSTQSWPSESRFAEIVAANGGKFVAQTGTRLTLYSSDAKELKKLDLPPPPQDFGHWRANTSRTGKSILFSTNNLMTTSPILWIWVDTDSLQVVHSWKEVQSGSNRDIRQRDCNDRV